MSFFCLAWRTSSRVGAEWIAAQRRNDRPGLVIRRYRPRIEGLFAHIERWTRKSDGDVHSRSASKDNVHKPDHEVGIAEGIRADDL